MGCLHVEVARAVEGVLPVAGRIGGLSLTASRVGHGVSMSSSRIGRMYAGTSRIGGMTVTCGLVCSVNKAPLLRVAPEHIFLMPGNNFTDSVLVISNVVWSVNV